MPSARWRTRQRRIVLGQMPRRRAPSASGSPASIAPSSRSRRSAEYGIMRVLFTRASYPQPALEWRNTVFLAITKGAGARTVAAVARDFARLSRRAATAVPRQTLCWLAFRGATALALGLTRRLERETATEAAHDDLAFVAPQVPTAALLAAGSAGLVDPQAAFPPSPSFFPFLARVGAELAQYGQRGAQRHGGQPESPARPGIASCVVHGGLQLMMIAGSANRSSSMGTAPAPGAGGTTR